MNTVLINPKDNAAVAAAPLKRGEAAEINGLSLTLLSDIPAGHKLAVRDICAGENVVKYGFPIGRAKVDIKAGEHIHSHNLRSNLEGLLDYEYRPGFEEPAGKAPGVFMGYRRPDGRVGIRNEVWIIPTVGCINSTVREIESRAQKYLGGNIDGIYSFTHPYGCSQLGGDLEMTLNFLCGLINHPNAGAVLVAGLGCENGNIGELKKRLGEYDPRRVKFLICQESQDEIAEGERLIEELAGYASGFSREECGTDKLVLGLKCGGSDGFSGLTANPLLGAVSDRIIAEGGTALLTEVPEMFGAETILMNRCRSREVFEKTVSLINDFKKYFMRYGEKTDENPSPGNKEGGITTLEEKSLGCIQKGGTAPVENVLDYAEQVSCRGLSLLKAPGNDLVAANALAASGAQIVLFTTGRGTPFGCPVPTVKISSNSGLFFKKPGWIDFDAGRLMTGSDISGLSREFYEYIIKLASGEIRAKSEAFDRRELAIFKDGVTL